MLPAAGFSLRLLTKKIDFPHSYPVQWRKEQGIRRLPLLFRTNLFVSRFAVPKGRTCTVNRGL